MVFKTTCIYALLCKFFLTFCCFFNIKKHAIWLRQDLLKAYYSVIHSAVSKHDNKLQPFYK